MFENIDMKKIFNTKRTLEEEKIYYYLAYKSETDETKKLILLKKLQELNEQEHQHE